MSEAQRPRIRIVNESGIGHKTHVLTEDGKDIAGAITEITVHLKVGEPNTARIEALLMGTDIDAEIVELQTRVLPPPLPKTQYRLTVDAPELTGPNRRSYYRLEKITPLPTYGVKEEVITSGHMAPVGPLELVCDAPE